MLFFNIWFLFMIIGILFAIAMFAWAVKRGQFEEQNRARYLPLRDLEDFEKMEKPEHSKKDAITFIAITLIGVSLLCTAIFLTIKN